MGGGATSVEFRLRTAQNGEYDVYDLNNGGGWGVPVGVKPVGKNCDSISCTPTLATCPDPKLALKDSYGQILGCASACYGGIGNSDQQCCNGAFAEAAKCTPDLIQFYSYFKEPCRHAYAYYQDSRQGSPTVNFLCKAEGDPGFMVTFCPEGDGDSGPKGGAATSTGRKTKSTGGGAATGNTNESGKIGEPTGTAAAVTQPSDIPAISAVPSLNVTSTNPAEEATAPPAGPTSPPVNASDEGAAATSTAPATATDDATASAADASSAASESAVPEETPGGISKTAMIGVGVGIALVAVLGVVVACVVSRRKNSQSTTAAPTKSAAAQSSDPEAGHTGGPPTGAGMLDNPFETSEMNADRTVAVQARATTRSIALATGGEDDNASFLRRPSRTTRPLTISRGSCTLTTPTPRAGLAGA